jgi:hypothetical protein
MATTEIPHDHPYRSNAALANRYKGSGDIKLTPRGKAMRALGIGMIAASSVFGTYKAAETVVDSAGPTNTPAELSKMNYVNATAAAGEGVEQMIRRTEPGILADAENRAEVIDYMVNHTGNADGMVGEGETLQIPVEPGQEVLPGHQIHPAETPQP